MYLIRETSMIQIAYLWKIKKYLVKTQNVKNEYATSDLIT